MQNEDFSGRRIGLPVESMETIEDAEGNITGWQVKFKDGFDLDRPLETGARLIDEAKESETTEEDGVLVPQ